MRIYDVTVPISAKTPTFPGDPSIDFHVTASIEKGDPANVTLLHFGAHTATHVDAPNHFIEGTSRVIDMPLDVLIGAARVIEIPDDVDAIDASRLNELQGATRVLFRTRNSQFWSEMDKGFRKDFTYITPDAAQVMVDAGVKLVGIDYLSVEKFGAEKFTTHTILLSNNVVIIEGLDLREVVAGEYELICLPLKVSGGTGDGAPARTVLRTFEGSEMRDEQEGQRDEG
jgi:arylformamidase